MSVVLEFELDYIRGSYAYNINQCPSSGHKIALMTKKPLLELPRQSETLLISRLCSPRKVKPRMTGLDGASSTFGH